VMGKRRQNGRKNGGGDSNTSFPTTKVPFHSFEDATLSAGGILTTSFSPRSTVNGSLNAICTQFDLYRVVKLQYRLLPMSTSNTKASMSYYPDADTQTLTV